MNGNNNHLRHARGEEEDGDGVGAGVVGAGYTDVDSIINYSLWHA